MRANMIQRKSCPPHNDLPMGSDKKVPTAGEIAKMGAEFVLAWSASEAEVPSTCRMFAACGETFISRAATDMRD